MQALPSLHAEPSAFAGFEQTPVPVLHVPMLWHWSSAVQTTGFEPVHVPDWQVSVCVQALPSLHEAVLLVNTQPVTVLQVSVVQTLLSLQTSVPVPGWHAPPEQTSPVVHALPSLHEAVLFVKTQPVDVLHVSVVHRLLSLQTVGVPG